MLAEHAWVQPVPDARVLPSDGDRPDGDGGHRPFALQVIEVSSDRIVGHHNFLNTDLFAAFGLPARLQP